MQPVVNQLQYRLVICCLQVDYAWQQLGTRKTVILILVVIEVRVLTACAQVFQQGRLDKHPCLSRPLLCSNTITTALLWAPTG